MIALLGGVVAACAGVLLAALDSPHVRDERRLERLCVVLLAVAAAATVTGAAFAVT